MTIPYRTQQGIKRFFVVVLVLAVVAALLWLCWLFWLSRFVVYTRDGVVLDFDREPPASLEQALPPVAGETVPVFYNEGDDAVEVSTDLAKLAGYYIDAAALSGDMEVIKAQLRQLPAGTPVMIEVKNSYGSFFYSTAVGESQSDSIDPARMDDLIQFLNRQDLYTIARLPALRDYYFGLHNTHNGLPTSGGFLWADDDYRYWLNPAKEGTLGYLSSIVTELHDLGFDEVLLTDFRFPDTSKIVFEGDKAQTLAESAQFLVNSCSGNAFAVSFEGSDGFTPPQGRSRVYRINVLPADIESIVATAGVADTQTQLAFITDLYDTRFDAYGVLRPLASAIADED